jgi:hypothetical protein
LDFGSVVNRIIDLLTSRLPAWARQGVLLVALLVGLWVFAVVANQHYPLRHWLLFVYARLWLLGLVFLLASLAAGWRFLGWLLPEPSAPGERLVVALALGVLVFVWGIFLLGIFGWLSKPAFFAWPAALLAFGGRKLARDFRRFWRRLRPFGFRLLQPRTTVEACAAVALVVGLIAIYLEVMTPTNVSFDSQWYHLSIAEQYASTGRIRPFVEGWFLGAVPQLASLVYTWAFISPGGLFEHVSLASHLEWFLFLATLGGVSVLTRRLVGGLRTPYAAAAMFLFPGIFLYDSSLVTTADHVMAFWGPPLALALLRLRRWFTPREAVLAALITSGAALTKYQSSYVVSGAILAVFIWTVRRRRLVPLAAFALTGIVTTSAHWLKNLVFYGDPLYPFLHSVFPSHPFREGGELVMSQDNLAVQFALHGTPFFKLRETLKTLFTFSLVPHDWGGFHRDRPVFGSLFTLLLPVLLFVRTTPDLWLNVGWAYLGIAIWWLTSHEDRYLQTLLPWMAACTAAFLVLAWRKSTRPVRGAVAMLVAFQVAWGADVYFLRTHAMAGDSILKQTVDHLAAGYEKRYEERLRMWGGLQEIEPALPKDAKVLVHEIMEKVGLGRPTVADWDNWQLGIEYFKYATPEATIAVWKRMGITHVVWKPESGATTYERAALQAVFLHAIELYGVETRMLGGYFLTRVAYAPVPPGASTPTRVAWLGCGADPPTGVYVPVNVNRRRPERVITPLDLSNDPSPALAEVSVAILRSACPDVAPATAVLNSSFKRVTGAGDVALWVRKR